jgi:transcriptional regulator with XRE-family HTH domain
MSPARSKDHIALGKAVRAVRNKSGMTQEQVSEASGIAPTYISDIERGIRNPSYEMLVSLAGALGAPLSEIIKRAERGEA